MPVDDLVDRAQLLETAFDIGVDAGDQLELRLAEVRGDICVWVSGEPSAAGCGELASEPSGPTRRLSFSMPRRRLLSTSGASVWSDISFSGTRTFLVAPSICLSSGWQIKSLRIGTD
jgi:hypothetical protein